MNNQSNPFQIVLLAALGLVAFVAVLIFAGVIPGFRAPEGGTGGTVILWGSIPQETIGTGLTEFQDQHEDEFTLNYVYQDPASLETNLVEALAAGRGPDLVILPHSSLVRRLENIAPISYDNYSQLNFNNSFVKESRLYLAGSGILALPLYLDPMVLYYNADLFTSARLVNPPKTWKELEGITKVLNQIDQNKNISVSAVALGKANNIRNAKDVLSLLIMQAGNSISKLSDGKLDIVLSQNLASGRNATADALDFFNRFANSSDPLYSWNSAQPEARQDFTSGRLAMYLGYASEYPLIQRQNPQLSVEVAPVPQLGSGASLTTIGRLFGVSVLRGSRNPLTAIKVAMLLSEASMAKSLADALQLAPVNKALFGSFPPDPALATFYQSAIFANGWLDPNPEATQKIFQKMVENSQSGAVSTGDAISAAVGELQMLTQ